MPKIINPSSKIPQTQNTGRVKVKGGTRSSPAFINYRMRYHDNITLSIAAFEAGIENSTEEIAKLAGPQITAAIQEEYESGQDRWENISDKWRNYKIKHGQDPRILHQHFGNRPIKYGGGPSLARAVQQLKVRSVFNSPTGIGYIFGIGRGFLHNPYVWFHEHGLGVTQRDFIFRGLEKGLHQTSNAIKESIIHTDKMISKRARQSDKKFMAQSKIRTGGGKIPGLGRTAISKAGIVYDLEPFEIETAQAITKYNIFSLGGWIWWVVPPSRWWAVLGKYSDLRHLISGELATSSAISAWLQALAMGQLGATIGKPLTKKSARRKYRRSLYKKVGYKR